MTSTQAKTETSILGGNLLGAREHVHRLSIELSAKTNVKYIQRRISNLAYTNTLMSNTL